MIAYTFYEFDARVRRYAETLARRGDHVDVIALRRDHQPARENINGVHLFRIQRRDIDEKQKFSYLRKLLLFLLRSMVFVSAKQLRRPYDLLHIHSVPDFEVFAAVLPKLMGSKLILDIHDLVPEFYASKFHVPASSPFVKLLKLMERVSAAFVDHVIIANDLWKNKIVGRSVSDDKCTAILNFPDKVVFTRRGRNGTNGKFKMLYPGTLNDHQGLDLAIRAFALIKDDAPEAEFHIFGRGPSKESLASLIAHLGLEDRVFLKDHVPLIELPPIMENSDLGVVPKRRNAFSDEAFSTKILEFMALGVPVLVADTKIDSYYFDESLVKFFRAGDEKDLANNMLLLIRKPELRQRLSTNATEYVCKNDWESKKQIYLDLVDRLVANAKISLASAR